MVMGDTQAIFGSVMLAGQVVSQILDSAMLL